MCWENGKGKASRFLSIEDEKPFHSSAVYASAIHSISLPLRMERPSPSVDLINASGAADMSELIQMLAGQARQNMVTTLDVAMPPPSLSGSLCRLLNSLHRNIFPPVLIMNFCTQGTISSNRCLKICSR